jgi:putative redox protein
MLTKGRHDLKDLRAHLVGERPEEPPKYFQKIHLHFTLKGDIPPEAVDRAIALSHEKHCSVWASLRQDIEFRTSYEIIRG